MFSYIIFFCFLLTIRGSKLSDWSEINKIYFYNIYLTDDNKFIAKKDIYRKEIIMSLPINLTLHPLEDFVFKEYFNQSAKDTLIGRLLIEKTLGPSSSFYDWIESLPKIEDIHDLQHFNEEELSYFNKRVYQDIIVKNRKEGFLKIRKNIPQDVLTDSTFNYESYNWAASIVEGHGYIYTFDHYEENKLGLIRHYNPNLGTSNNLILIPLLDKINVTAPEIFRTSSVTDDYEDSNLNYYTFKHIQQNGDRLELRAQKFFSKGSEFKVIDTRSNRELFQYNGIFIQDNIMMDFLLRINSKFDIPKVKMCWELNLGMKRSFVFEFLLNYEQLNMNLLLYSRIALIEEKTSYDSDKEEIIKQYEEGIPILNNIDIYLIYMRILLTKQFNFMKLNKTSLFDDILENSKNQNISHRKKLSVKFTTAEKLVFNKHILMISRRILRELKLEFLQSLRKYEI